MQFSVKARMKLPQQLTDFISFLGIWGVFSLLGFVPLALVCCVCFHFHPVAATWLAAIATPVMLLLIAFLSSIAGSIDMNAYSAPPDPHWHRDHSYILVGSIIGTCLGIWLKPALQTWLIAHNSPPDLINSLLFPLFVAITGLVIGASLGQSMIIGREVSKHFYKPKTTDQRSRH